MKKDRHIAVMGILNLTDDSYFPQSRCADVSEAMDRAEKMLDEGADIIDLGACSTRPGSFPVGEEEEWRRLGPVLKELRREFPDVKVSIDTYWASVVMKAYDLIGKFIVNDISAGEDDPDMLPLVGRLGLEYVAMHKRGTPETMQSMTSYSDIVEEVSAYFRDFSLKASRWGIRDWILDPGFGFAKTIGQNYTLLGHLDDIRSAVAPDGHIPRILTGVSRKSMIYKYLGISPEDSLPATQVVHLAALQGGADILRVHDVAEAGRTVSLYRIL